jgi:sodium/bile acid cotransporter 7
LVLEISILNTQTHASTQALREFFSPAEHFAKKYRIPLSLLSTTLLAVLIWQTLSSARNTLFQTQAVMIVAVILLGIGIHLFYLLINYLVVW